MALQLLCGPSGSGKTHWIYEQCIRQSEEKDSKQFYFLIVPEQATLQTQQELIRLHPRHGLLNVDVIGFTTLAYRVFEELKTPMLQMIDQSGRMMLLRRAIEKVRPHLTVLKREVTHSSTVEEIMHTLGELNAYQRIDDEQSRLVQFLREAPGGNPLLIGKLKDLMMIWTAYRQELQDRFMDKDELLPLLCKEAVRSQLLSQSVIYIDGFQGFTPMQYEVITHLLLYCKEVIISICTEGSVADIDERKDEFGLFYSSGCVAEQLKIIAEKNRIAVHPDCCLQQRPVMRLRQQPELAHLEQYYERSQSKVYEKEPQQIRVYRMEQPTKEMQFVTEEVWRLVREEHYRFGDIAVIAGSPENYQEIARRMFDRADIPYFIDIPRSMLDNDYIRFQLSLFQLAVKGMDMDSMRLCLKYDFLLPRQEVDLLENFILAHPVYGFGRWNTPFFGYDTGMIEASEQLHPEEGSIPSASDMWYICEGIRSHLMEILAPFYQAVGTGRHTAEEYITALQRLLEQCDASAKLEQMIQYLNQEEMYDKALEYGSMEEKASQLYRQNVLLLGEELFLAEELLEILESGFSSIRIGVVPPTLDRLVLGDLRRTRIPQVKALFFVGVNEGVLPAVAEKTGILSDRDREFLLKCDIELSPTSRQEVVRDKLYLYQMLTKPSERLYLSYPAVDTEGTAVLPSYVIMQLRQLFPKLSVQNGYVCGMPAMINPDYSLEYFAEELRKEHAPEWDVLGFWYSSQLDYEKQVEQLQKLTNYRYEPAALEPETAAVLYSDRNLMSASRLEKYSTCAFMHFLTYGLELRPREQYRLNAADSGNIYHAALQYILSRMKFDRETGQLLNDAEEKEQIVSDAMDYAFQKAGSLAVKMEENDYYRYLKENWLQEMQFLYDTLAFQISQGEFRNFICEARFQDRGTRQKGPQKQEEQYPALAVPGTDCRLQGIIDRIDFTEDGDYVRIIDYKTGNRQINFGQLLEGLQMQLPLYMTAVLEKKRQENQTVLPVGMYYFHADEPIVSLNYEDLYREDDSPCTDQELQEKIYAEAWKRLKWNGLTNDSVSIVEKQERDLTQVARGWSKLVSSLQLVAAEEGKTEKVISSESHALPTEDFELLSDYVLHKAGELYQDMVQGNVAVSPYRDKKQIPCSYCEYHSICHFDPNVKGFSYREIASCGIGELREKIFSTLVTGKATGEKHEGRKEPEHEPTME